MSNFRAARVKQKIVKVPENEVVVTFGRSQTTIAGRVDLEKDLAIHQQSEKLEPRNPILPTELFDLLGSREQGDGGRNLWIADFEQRARSRRFQHHLVAAPSYVREPRQDDHVGMAELRRSRPIIGS